MSRNQLKVEIGEQEYYIDKDENLESEVKYFIATLLRKAKTKDDLLRLAHYVQLSSKSLEVLIPELIKGIHKSPD